jgi:hypothetical protein
MPGTDNEIRRTKPTSPKAAEALGELSKSAETFGEPKGTLAEARRQGADVDGDETEPDTALERHDELERARTTMWRTSTRPATGAPGEVAAQEEETARIADHLAFPGAGVRELREEGRLEEAVEVADADRATPTRNPDRFPPAEWPPKEPREAADRADAAGRAADEERGRRASMIDTLSRGASERPWVLAGACLGAGLVGGLILRSVMDRIAGQPSAGETVTGVKEAARTKAEELKSAAKGKAEAVKSAAKDKAGDVKSAARGKADDVKSAAREKAGEVKSAARDKVRAVKSATKGKAEDVKTTAREKAGRAKSASGDKAGAVKTNARQKAREVKSAAKGTAEDVKTTARAKAREVKSAARGTAENVKTTARAKAGEAKSAAKGTAGNVKTTAREKAGEAKSAARETAEDLKTTAREKADDVRSATRTTGAPTTAPGARQATRAGAGRTGPGTPAGAGEAGRSTGSGPAEGSSGS